MKISLEWIKRYLPLDRTPEEIEEALTLIGFEVEKVERIGLPPLEKRAGGGSHLDGSASERGSAHSLRGQDTVGRGSQ